MAYIGHRCGCGHPAIHHGTDSAARSHCTADAGRACGRDCRMSKQSMKLPTFDLRGRTIERIVPPGGRFGTVAEGGGLQTCDCDNCQVLYEQLITTA